MGFMSEYLPQFVVLELVVTSLLVGLIWVIQLIVYPSFNYIAEEKWQSFHQLHSYRISCIVTWLMPLELILALLIISNNETSVLALFSLALLVIVWLSTFLLQVPAHNKLSKTRSPKVVLFLINSNWLRTIAWTLKLGVILISLSNS